ncbi:ATP-binding protein [Streptomyces apocyni]|uniref:ATP-binding protein n=1 Tax=Streptomyces apocyni TaxID=2654677 RepID=UPI0012E9FCFF|nr:ATP-binding protein [Streptomyces apocyni]
MNQETSPQAPSPQQFAARVPATRRGARLARALATEELRAWGLPLDPASLVIAELTANAVLHAHVPGRDLHLTLAVTGDTLRIEVTDTRPDRLPAVQRPGPGDDSESGRGLLLVEALANRWGVTSGPTPRKTVWAELALGATQEAPWALAVPTGVKA